MSGSHRTKLLLAAGIKEMTAGTSFSRIRVGALCAHCGIDRRTFYYHFRDIYDLAAWMFNQIVDDCIPDSSGKFRLSGIKMVMDRMRDDPCFYRSALKEDSQNALWRHILANNEQMYQKAACRLRGVETLSEEELFAIRYHCFGSLFMLWRWLFNDCTPSSAEFVRMLADAMPPILREIYELDADKGGNSDG